MKYKYDPKIHRPDTDHLTGQDAAFIIFVLVVMLSVLCYALILDAPIPSPHP